MKEAIHALLAGPLQVHAADQAIVATGRPSLSYAELARQLQRDHDFLRGAGFGSRSRIGVAMPAGPEALVAIAAVSRSAACAHFEPELDVGSLARLMTAMRLDAVIVSAASTSNAVRAAREVGIPLIELSTSDRWAAGAHEMRTDARRAPAAPELPGPDDLAFLWSTSGTTGVPKIVPYEQWRICFDVRKRIARRGIGSSDRCLVTAVMSSAVTARVGVLSTLAAGAAAIHAGEPTAESVLDAIESLAPTMLFAAPALHSRLLELLDRRGTAINHRLRAIYSSFAEQSPQVRERLERRLGVPMVIVYGMTEVGGIAETPIPPAAAPPGSVGQPMLDVMIADDHGNLLGAGREGEVWVRGPEVIAAYESPPEANRDAFRDGWFRTGDRGLLDERGFMHLTGRIKDVINRGGVKVAPSEVERALESHPAVREAAVFARHHATLGEDVCAAVVFAAGRIASEAELRRFLRQRMSAPMVPTRIVAASALPRNANGKLQRTELSAFGETLLTRAWQPPQGPCEEQVAMIFRHALQVDDIGRHDQFFDRGGDSLRAVEVIERVQQQFGVPLTMDALLGNPSVAGLAKVICESAGVAGETAPRTS
jgi:acyl-CoA synthetase (AMP-forming)/AMP-acid ligase II/acyl carrier protein